MLTATTTQEGNRLPIKPATLSTAILFRQWVAELQATFSLRSLNLSTDSSLLYKWVTKAYAQKFWQLIGSRTAMERIYGDVLSNPQAHSFIGLIDDTPICQIDVYSVQADELARHIDADPMDAGLHLLMCPPREMRRGWSYYALKLFQQYYFSFEQSGTLYAEPDKDNHPANQLATHTGFRFLKTIELSYKTANLYAISRQDFTGV